MCEYFINRSGETFYDIESLIISPLNNYSDEFDTPDIKIVYW
jgi:hypothetical protein